MKLVEFVSWEDSIDKDLKHLITTTTNNIIIIIIIINNNNNNNSSSSIFTEWLHLLESKLLVHLV